MAEHAIRREVLANHLFSHVTLLAPPARCGHIVYAGGVELHSPG
jgi:hypothetical protein